MKDPIKVQVVYAAKDQVFQFNLDLLEEQTVWNAIEMSGLLEQFDYWREQKPVVGIYGKIIKNPEMHWLKQGDRIEIYRPLTADPKALRLRRLQG